MARRSPHDDGEGNSPTAASRHGRLSADTALGALLARSAKGDDVAFAELYDATSARVFGLVLRVVRSHALAEEVTQDTYLQAWQTSARYDESKGSAVSWLMTLAHRRAVDRVRSTEAHKRRDSSYFQSSFEADHDVTADAAGASMEAQRVRRACAGLTTVQREAIELAYFGGLTYVEVAERVGIPVGTAKTRIRDGLIRLRDLV